MIDKSDKREAVETALRAGMGIRECARQFGFGRDRVQVHKDVCMGMSRKASNPEIGTLGAAGERLRWLYEEAKKSYRWARQKGDTRAADGFHKRMTEIALEFRMDELARNSTKKKPGYCACGRRLPESVIRVEYENSFDSAPDSRAARSVSDDEGAYRQAISAALGYSGPCSPEALDQEFLDKLSACANRHSGNERLVATALRMASILKAQPLPQHVENEIDRLLGEGGSHAIARTIPPDDEADEPEVGDGEPDERADHEGGSEGERQRRGSG